jgi:hypothetical protein
MVFLDVMNKVVVDLFGLRGTLFRFEQETIKKVSALLLPEASLKLLSQLSQSNHFVRDPSGKSVHLRCIGWFFSNATYAVSSLYEKSRPPFRLASAIIRKRNSNSTFKAEMWIVGGHLFEINYDKSPFSIMSLCVV